MTIPEPYVGLVVNYEYLWKNQDDDGIQDGNKSRPSCIVVSNKQENGDTIVLVLPITHSPQEAATALKIPDEVKKQLGLDDEEQWVVCSELNKFIWPGYDIRPISRAHPDKYDYGTITAGFLNAIKTKLMTLRHGKKLRVVSRSD